MSYRGYGRGDYGGTLGDFVAGLEGGMDARDRWLEAGQKRKDAERVNEGNRRLYEEEIGEPIDPETNALFDPFKLRMQTFISSAKDFFGAGGKNPAATAAIPAPATQAYGTNGAGATSYAIDLGDTEFADGGKVKDPRRDRVSTKERVNIRAPKPPVDTSAYDAKGRLGKAADTLRGRNPGAGRMGANGALAKYGALPALAVTGVQVATTPTEQYRERFGMETDDPSLAGDIGVRTLGAASDFGNAMTFGQAGRFFRDKQSEPKPSALPVTAEKAAVIEALPPEEPQAAATSERLSVSAKQSAKTGEAVPVAIGAPEEDDTISMLGTADFDSSEIPSMSTRDWVAYREKAVPALMLTGLDPQAANAKVTQMQHEGFTNYAKQGAMMLQAGNKEGAARALRAAYQYFPTGKDVKFGFQKGELVAMGINEETGEPSGAPQVITNEYLAAMLTNFEDPKNFLAWTKDQQAQAFEIEKYNETEKPLTEMQMNTGYADSETSRMNAIANQQQAAASANYYNSRAASGGAGGMKPVDIARSEQAFGEQLASRGMGMDMTPEGQEEYENMLSILGQVRLRTPHNQHTDGEVFDIVMDAYDNGTLPQVLGQLGIQ